MLRLSNIKLGLDEDNIKKSILKTLKIKEQDLINYSIYKESIDARNKNHIHFVYTVDIEVVNEKELYRKHKKDLQEVEEFPETSRVINFDKAKKPPVIIGFGPAGMFAALALAEEGLKPIVYERGQKIEDRIKSVEEFWQKGILNPESNIQFGEGGAGTFSDGKLTARVKNGGSKEVLEKLVKYGADPRIIYSAIPHLGTDALRAIVKNIREEIIRLGGTIHFNSKLTSFTTDKNKINTITINDNLTIEVDDVILAIGHSARDTFQMLHEKEISLSAKEFAVGFRIEHKQEIINKAQYGRNHDHPKLPPAEYKLTYNAKNGRGVYTFCMCPGGYVVNASSEPNHLVTNGMSYSKRDGENANSAIVVQVNKEDFPSPSPLAGIDFQRQLEHKAFVLGGANYQAPSETVEEYLGKKDKGEVTTTFSNGTIKQDLTTLLPEPLTEAMKEALIHFSKTIKGFETGILTAVETRTSSPVRINRNEELESISIDGLYPVGEGSGYSGGIVTSALDGIKGANAILQKYS